MQARDFWTPGSSHAKGSPRRFGTPEPTGGNTPCNTDTLDPTRIALEMRTNANAVVTN